MVAVGGGVCARIILCLCKLEKSLLELAAPLFLLAKIFLQHFDLFNALAKNRSLIEFSNSAFLNRHRFGKQSSEFLNTLVYIVSSSSFHCKYNSELIAT